jgi:hypothetical protein
MSSNWLYCTTSVLIAAAGRVLVEVGLAWTTVLSRSSSHGSSSSSYVGVSIALGVSVHEVELSVEVTRVPLSTMIVVGAPSYAVEVDEPPFAGMKPGPITLIG